MFNFQNPLQKGTEVFPEVIVPLPVVRVTNTSINKELGQRIINTYQGVLRHFYKAQKQAYSLSSIENMHKSITFPGGKVTYTNIQGQEYLEIEVSAEEIERIAKQEPYSFEYDWLIIDLSAVDERGERPFDQGSLFFESQAKIHTPAFYEMPKFLNANYIGPADFALYYEVLPYLNFIGSYRDALYREDLPSSQQYSATYVVNITRLTEYHTSTEPIRIEFQAWYDNWFAVNPNNYPPFDSGRPVKITYSLYKGSESYAFDPLNADFLNNILSAPIVLADVPLFNQPDVESLYDGVIYTYQGDSLGSVIYTPGASSSSAGSVSYSPP